MVRKTAHRRPTMLDFQAAGVLRVSRPFRLCCSMLPWWWVWQLWPHTARNQARTREWTMSTHGRKPSSHSRSGMTSITSFSRFIGGNAMCSWETGNSEWQCQENCRLGSIFDVREPKSSEMTFKPIKRGNRPWPRASDAKYVRRTLQLHCFEMGLRSSQNLKCPKMIRSISRPNLDRF